MWKDVKQKDFRSLVYFRWLRSIFIVATRVEVAPSAMRSAMKGDVWSKSFRMAVNIAEWHPTEPEWNKAINCIQVFFAQKSKVKNRPKNSSKWRERIFQQFFRIVAKSFYQHLRGTDNAWVPSNLVIFPHHSQKKIECRSQKEKH